MGRQSGKFESSNGSLPGDSAPAVSRVGLLRQSTYDRAAIKEQINTLCRVLAFKAPRSGTVLLKPNLISANRQDGLACTHAEFIAATAEWFIDHGCKVLVGDSPAFGATRGVMAALGMDASLRGLPVTLVDFTHGVGKELPCGAKVRVARPALECDLLVNLPKCKAHCLLLVTLGVKNLFGTVLGWRKPWLHMTHGATHQEFCRVLADLLALFPNTFTLLDGIVALHESGPIHGSPYDLGVVAASDNPVAIDTTMLQVLGLEPARSPLWRECLGRGLAGADSEAISYPLSRPAGSGFCGARLSETGQFYSPSGGLGRS